MSIRYDFAHRPCTDVEPVGMLAVREYTMHRWGGVDAGICACRNIRDGGTLSQHANCAAWDWQQVSRELFLDAFWFMVAHAIDLQMQRLTDYEGRTSWDARVGGGRGGMEKFNGFGAGSLRNWHLERNTTGRNDPRAIGVLVGSGPLPVGDEMEATDIVDVFVTRKGRELKLQRDGGIIAPHGGYFGSYPGLQDVWKQGPDGHPVARAFNSITARPDGKSGYAIWSVHGEGYSFGPDTLGFLRPEARPR